MGSQSTTTPSLADNHSNKDDGSPESVKPMGENEQVINMEGTQEASPKSAFVNTEPMREEQVQNAVKFLSHPKVRGSPVIYRRSFLERKGLTKEEIDEAFRRVPDPPPNATTSTQDGQLKPSLSTQPQVSSQTPLPVAVPPGATSMMPVVKQSRFQWSHAFFAVGILAASGCGTAVLLKNVIVPRFKAWIRNVVLEENHFEKKEASGPTLAEEAAAAAKAAAVAAADVAKASQDMLNSKNEERKFFESCMALLDVQMKEMKSMGNAIRKLEAAREVNQPDVRQPAEEIVQSSMMNGSNSDSLRSLISQQSKVNGRANEESFSERPSSVPASTNPAVGQYPKSYMEIMAMIQRGEKPPGIREIDDRPPNPNQPPSNPHMAPRAKPWESAQMQQNLTYGPQPETKVEASDFVPQVNGISTHLNGKSSAPSGDTPEPWWRRKSVTISEIQPATGEERPIRRAWVPPQPPSVVIPEAAAAIRKPKSAIQREQSNDEKSMVNGGSVTDETSSSTKAMVIPENGSAVEQPQPTVQTSGSGYEQLVPNGVGEKEKLTMGSYSAADDMPSMVKTSDIEVAMEKPERHLDLKAVEKQQSNEALEAM
ncbi:peroxisomal membrane protein PEX14-like [Aristolochia californica]|uniref:peroxisomal membrane protein PEX14-like n=1 Tax=Aristolochia californica TaxID=171875 RepID=UPI0035DE4B0D